MRTLTSPSAGSTIVDKLKTYEGGTGQVTAAAALTAMNATPLALMGVANGVLGLDAAGKIALTNLPVDKVGTISVVGPTQVVKGSITAYNIGNYDAFTTYTVAATVGSVSIVNDVIQYQAPATAQAGGFTINGRPIAITVNDYKPNAPTLTGVTGRGSPAALTFTSSVYSNNAGSATHLNSDWQIATDAAFTSVVKSSLADTVNKTSYTNSTVSVSTTYYSRVRYRDNAGGVSDWSNTLVLTTAASYTISTEEVKFLPTTGDGIVYLGGSVAMNSDGTRLAVGAYGYSGSGAKGSVYIFTRSGTTWALEQKITTAITGGTDTFGGSVAITPDSTRLAIGAPGDLGASSDPDYPGGAVYIYLRTGTTWSLERKILGGGNGYATYFGQTVTITDDGLRVAIGTAAYSQTQSYQGAVYVFLRTGTTWAQEAILTATSPVPNSYLGAGVAFSSDGTRLVATQTNTQAALSFTRTGTNWANDANAVTSNYNASGTGLRALAITPDGTRIIIGSINSSGNGHAEIFIRSGANWVLEGTFSTGNSVQVADSFGFSVSISSDGSRAVVGCAGDPAATPGGAAYVYTRSGSTWTQENRITASDASNGARFGGAVVMTRDATRISVGASSKYNSGDYGTAYVYR